MTIKYNQDILYKISLKDPKDVIGKAYNTLKPLQNQNIVDNVLTLSFPFLLLCESLGVRPSDVLEKTSRMRRDLLEHKDKNLQAFEMFVNYGLTQGGVR